MRIGETEFEAITLERAGNGKWIFNVKARKARLDQYRNIRHQQVRDRGEITADDRDEAVNRLQKIWNIEDRSKIRFP